MDREEFQEALLQVMEGKVHRAWSRFNRGDVPADRLHIHLEQEYEVYVRDFPVLIGRAYVQCPIPAVRRELAENLYEEETGGIAAGRPHPELFLEYPRGLGMDLGRFERVALLPAAAAYRAFLDEASGALGWAVGTAVVTIFIEGNAYERSVLDPAAPRRPEPPPSEHPLVVHYGLPLEHLALTKAHRSVEGDHRDSAWRCVLDFTPTAERPAVVAAMQRALALWLAYRDEVSAACGLSLEEGA
jgi:hypothetical protein